MNNVSLTGNIATEINLQYTPQGDAVARFNLAVKHPFKKDRTDFIPIEVWKAGAEATANYCNKGSKVAVTGNIEVDNYEKDGQKKVFTKVVGRVEFLDSKKDNQQSQSNNQQNQQQNNELGGEPFDESSLPF